MDKTAEGGIAARLAAGFAEVAQFFRLDPEAALQEEMEAIAAPHLAVLLHKREKLAGTYWTRELTALVQRSFLPRLSRRDHEIGKLVLLLNGLVSKEAQRRARVAMAEPLPQVSSFSTSWAQ